MQRHHLAVDLRADAAVPDVGVDLVGEIQRGRSGGEVLDIALRREDVDLILGEVDLQRVHELLGVLRVLLPVEHRAQPVELRVAVCASTGSAPAAPAAGALVVAVLVEPVRGDAELRRLLHLARADLDLQRQALGPDHRRVQRLVHVELRHRDEVLEAPGHRLPQRMHDADRLVAVLHGLDDHAHRRQVEDLVELPALLGHLRVDRIEVLGAAGDVGLDAPQLLGEVVAGLLDVLLALLALLVDKNLDLGVLARVQCLEREILELPLDRVDAEPVRDRRVDLQRLLRLVDLLLLGHRVDRAHVVQAVGELDQDDPHVVGHRHHHLAVVLGLRLVARLERDAGELRDAVDDVRDLVAELMAHLGERCRRVLDGVVQQRRAQRLRVQAHAGADLRDADRVMDEVLARQATLVGVVLTGEDEGQLDLLAVDLHGGHVGVLLDDREDVRQQAALERGEVGAVDLRVMRRGDLVDGRAACAGALARGGPYAAFALCALSHLRPSSYA